MREMKIWLKRIATLTVALWLFGGIPETINGQENPPAPENKTVSVDQISELIRQANESEAQGNYDAAIPLRARLVAIAEKEFGPEHPDNAVHLYNLAWLYKEKGDYGRAEPLYERALAIVEKAHGPEHLDVAASLNNLALFYQAQGNYRRAEPLFQRALAIRERLLGPEHRDVGTSINNLAVLYQYQDNIVGAEPLLQRSLAIAEKTFEPTHPEVATALSNLALLYRAKGNYQQSETLFQRALAIREKALGPEHPMVIFSLTDLGELYRIKGDYGRAEALLQRALATREKALGPEHLNVAESLGYLAGIYWAKGDYKQAESLLRRVLTIEEKLLGSEHINVGTNLNNLALLLKEMGDYARAEALYRRALTIAEKALGPEHPSAALTLGNLANLYWVRGDYARAEPLQLRALLIAEKALGSEHPDVLVPLNNIALFYQTKGDYLRAKPLFQRAVLIAEKALGPEHPTVAKTLSNLATLYQEKGDHKQAEPLLQRAVAIQEKALGLEHPDVAISLNNLAQVYRLKGEYGKGEPLLQRAIAIDEKALGPEHANVALFLNNLGLLYEERNDYVRAEPLFRRALTIYERALGPEHPNLVQPLNNLALIYSEKGDFVQAQSLYQRALVINEKALGSMHPTTAQVINNLAILYLSKDENVQAVEFLTRGNYIREHNLALILTTGSEDQKRLYVNTLVAETNLSVSLHTISAPNDLQAARLALTTVLRRKGRVLDAMTDSIEALRRRSNPDDRALLEQLSTAQTPLAALMLKGPGKTAPAQHQATIAKLEAEVQRLEAAISARSAEFRVQSQPVTLERVQEAIPSGAALIEIMLYRPFNAKAKTTEEKVGAARYVVYVLRREGAPSWVDLGDASAVDGDVAKLRAALSRSQHSDVNLLARTLDEKVMRPVRKLLGDIKHIFISPDGALNLVPFAALVDARGRYLVEDYTITYLTSGRDLLRLQVSGESKQPPLVIADPFFDLQMQRASSQTARTDESANARRSGSMEQMSFKPLPGTAQEAKVLGGILPEVKVLTGEQATEAALKQVSGPRVLHVATHGFFLPDQKQEAAEGTRGLGLAVGEGQRTAPRIENPLLRSGLALAGANARQSADGEDGVLTALEAAGLNLWGTKLVVLSACETGVGRVSNGNGVYGLRRALVLAGSESQMMSLWQVSDEATRDLMISYYKCLMAGEGRTEALRQVQLEMIKNKGQVTSGRSLQLGEKASSESADHSHPYFWAAFIQSGDWRSMDGKTTSSK
ncbi:MAG: tetratricopeptide repeat protein [Pyrinomonadaceae bacterium]